MASDYHEFICNNIYVEKLKIKEKSNQLRQHIKIKGKNHHEFIFDLDQI